MIILSPIISFREFVAEKEREDVVGRNDVVESERIEMRRTDLKDNEVEILSEMQGEMQENVIVDNHETFAEQVDGKSNEDPEEVHEKEAERKVVTREVYDKMTDKEKAEWIGISADNLTSSIKRFQQKMDELGIYFEYSGDQTDAFFKLEKAVSNKTLPENEDRLRSKNSR